MKYAIEYAANAIEQVRRALSDTRSRYGLLADRPQRFCPRHGDKYVIRRGTNRCPKGRKRKVNCL